MNKQTKHLAALLGPGILSLGQNAFAAVSSLAFPRNVSPATYLSSIIFTIQ